MKLLLSVTKRYNMRCPNCLWILEKGEFFDKSDISFQNVKNIFEYYKKNSFTRRRKSIFKNKESQGE